MTLAILKYIPKALLSFIGELFVWTFCWFIAFFCYRQEESRVTGYPSQFPGKLREHIDFPFTWVVSGSWSLYWAIKCRGKTKRKIVQ